MIILSVEKIKRIVLFLLVLLLLYTRFVGLNWGLPYPFHPDERNMAVAVEQLHCNFSIWRECFNPNFFAYGQFPLYLAYLLIYLFKLLNGHLLIPPSFLEATLALRFISALASVAGVWMMWKIVELFLGGKQSWELKVISGLLFIFSPILIQAAHFGTTEALLMFFYSALVYLGLKLLNQKISLNRLILFSGLISGLAIATKVTALIFTALPILLLLGRIWLVKGEIKKTLLALFKFGLLTALIGIIFSPYNLLAINDFLGSMRYESAVAAGTERVFYTRQFENTLPVIFQFSKIFPYTFGWPILFLFVAGLFFLPFNKQYNWLRYAWLIYFLPVSFLYAKWTRFMTPVMPLMLIIAVLALVVFFKRIKAVLWLIVLLAILPGLAYLTIYTHPDVRQAASDWIYRYIPSNSFILSETGNVVDIPLRADGYKIVSFNFYNLDEDYKLQKELSEEIKKADYIFVPSRRIFMNRLGKQYPLLNIYYDKLFSGQLGFKLVTEFTAYPKLSFAGRTLLEFPDEQAEETWTVFDHPVIRIYQRKL